VRPIVKIFCSELYQKITEETLDIAGEEARFLDDLPAGNGEVDAMNLYLDSRALAIFGGVERDPADNSGQGRARVAILMRRKGGETGHATV
jgi:hypothetical protein